jgi:hypothetical protein
MLSLMRGLGRDFPGPDHTQRSRRTRHLQVTIPGRERQEPVHLVVDSTGLKSYGEGKVCQHGAGKRRAWRKVHLAVDGPVKEVIGVEVTTADWRTARCSRAGSNTSTARWNKSTPRALMTPATPVQLRRRGKPSGSCRRDNAGPWEEGPPRNAVRAQVAERGLTEGKQASGCQRRSIAENALYRLKQRFGDSLASRLFETRVSEVQGTPGGDECYDLSGHAVRSG